MDDPITKAFDDAYWYDRYEWYHARKKRMERRRLLRSRSGGHSGLPALDVFEWDIYNTLDKWVPGNQYRCTWMKTEQERAFYFERARRNKAIQLGGRRAGINSV